MEDILKSDVVQSESSDVLKIDSTLHYVNGNACSWDNLPKHVYSERNKTFLRSLCGREKLPTALDTTEGLLELAHKLRVAEKDMYGNREDAVAGLLPLASVNPAFSMTNGVTVQNPVSEFKPAISPGINRNHSQSQTASAVPLLKHVASPWSYMKQSKKPSLWSLLIGAKGSESLDIEDDLFAKYKKHSEDENGEMNDFARPLTETEMEAIVSSAINCVIEVRSGKSGSSTSGEADAPVADNSASNAKESQAEVTEVPEGSLTVAGLLRKFKCSLCTYETDNKSHLRRHQSSVHGINVPYFCYLCRRDFARSEKIRHHFQRVHPNVVYNEKLCRKSNYSSHSEESNVKSENGNFKSENHTSLDETHAKSVHGDAASDEEAAMSTDLADLTEMNLPLVRGDQQPLKCTHCSYIGRDIWGLKRHIIDRHSKRKPFHCTECIYSTSRRHRMINHLKSHDRLVCMYCKLVCEDFGTFRAHLKACCAEETARKLTCQVCRVTLPNKKLLIEHKAKYHNISVFSCDLCLFTSEDKKELNEHLSEHNVSIVSCQFCSKDFRSTPQLDCHLRTSHGIVQQSHLVKPTTSQASVLKKMPIPRAIPPAPMLKCTKCEFETVYPSVMKSHEETHGEVKKCGYGGCSFGTTQEKLLELHRSKSHKEEHMVQKMYNTKGRYTCPLCTDRSPFRYRRSYEKHMERCHSMDEKCPVCDQRFYTFDALKNHITVTHDAEVEEVSDSDEEGVDTSSVDTTVSSLKTEAQPTHTKTNSPAKQTSLTLKVALSSKPETSLGNNPEELLLKKECTEVEATHAGQIVTSCSESGCIASGTESISTQSACSKPENHSISAAIQDIDQCSTGIKVLDHCYAAS